MDLLSIKLDLWPPSGTEHFLPDESDVLKTRRDLLVVQLQALALEVALRGCSHTHTRTHTINTWIKNCCIQKQTGVFMMLKACVEVSRAATAFSERWIVQHSD